MTFRALQPFGLITKEFVHRKAITQPKGRMVVDAQVTLEFQEGSFLGYHRLVCLLLAAVGGAVPEKLSTAKHGMLGPAPCHPFSPHPKGGR